MLIERIARVRARGIRAAGQHVGVLDHGNNVGRVSTASTFGVVGVDGAAFEGGDGLLDEAGFVERVGVDKALDIVFVADPGNLEIYFSFRYLWRVVVG